MTFQRRLVKITKLILFADWVAETGPAKFSTNPPELDSNKWLQITLFGLKTSV